MVLAICDGMYVPVREDMISEGRPDEWRKYLEGSGRGRLWQRTRMIKVTPEAMACPRERYLEPLLWSRRALPVERAGSARSMCREPARNLPRIWDMARSGDGPGESSMGGDLMTE